MGIRTFSLSSSLFNTLDFFVIFFYAHEGFSVFVSLHLVISAHLHLFSLAFTTTGTFFLQLQAYLVIFLEHVHVLMRLCTFFCVCVAVTGFSKRIFCAFEPFSTAPRYFSVLVRMWTFFSGFANFSAFVSLQLIFTAHIITAPQILCAWAICSHSCTPVQLFSTFFYLLLVWIRKYLFCSTLFQRIRKFLIVPNLCALFSLSLSLQLVCRRSYTFFSLLYVFSGHWHVFYFRTTLFQVFQSFC